MENKNEKILIVDDQKLNLRILNSILSDKYQVLEARSGQEAVCIANDEMPDLILMDIVMPDIDGFEVVRRLKNDDKLKDIPVIFITALSNPADEEKGLLLGAVDYIGKPFSPAIVKVRVENHLKIVRQRKMIESIAMLDGLTEIPNRRSYIIRLEEDWRRAMRDKTNLSVSILDIDFFKQYNDNYGHSKGDDALKSVGALLSRSFRRVSDFAARIGGEEFSTILLGNGPEEAVILMNSLCKAVQKLGILHEYSQVAKALTVSIGGVTCIPEFGTNPNQIIEAADRMLYKAKGSGRNRVEWSVLPAGYGN